MYKKVIFKIHLSTKITVTVQTGKHSASSLTRHKLTCDHKDDIHKLGQGNVVAYIRTPSIADLKNTNSN